MTEKEEQFVEIKRSEKFATLSDFFDNGLLVLIFVLGMAFGICVGLWLR